MRRRGRREMEAPALDDGWVVQVERNERVLENTRLTHVITRLTFWRYPTRCFL